MHKMAAGLLSLPAAGATEDKLARVREYVARMQALIQDLLAYSRVGTHGKGFEPVDAGDLIATVLRDLGPARRVQPDRHARDAQRLDQMAAHEGRPWTRQVQVSDPPT